MGVSREGETAGIGVDAVNGVGVFVPVIHHVPATRERGFSAASEDVDLVVVVGVVVGSILADELLLLVVPVHVFHGRIVVLHAVDGDVLGGHGDGLGLNASTNSVLDGISRRSSKLNTVLSVVSGGECYFVVGLIYIIRCVVDGEVGTFGVILGDVGILAAEGKAGIVVAHVVAGICGLSAVVGSFLYCQRTQRLAGNIAEVCIS